MYLTDGWYWDMNDATRAWSKRYFAKMKKEAVDAAGGRLLGHHQLPERGQGGRHRRQRQGHGPAEEDPINDMFAKNGEIRPDGRMVHDMYLMQVKKPKESKRRGTTTRCRRPSRAPRPT
jgi:branched-chain amino acid transport system substrate-binding protein